MDYLEDNSQLKEAGQRRVSLSCASELIDSAQSTSWWKNWKEGTDAEVFFNGKQFYNKSYNEKSVSWSSEKKDDGFLNKDSDWQKAWSCWTTKKRQRILRSRT